MTWTFVWSGWRWISWKESRGLLARQPSPVRSVSEAFLHERGPGGGGGGSPGLLLILLTCMTSLSLLKQTLPNISTRRQVQLFILHTLHCVSGHLTQIEAVHHVLLTLLPVGLPPGGERLPVLRTVQQALSRSWPCCHLPATTFGDLEWSRFT